MGLIRALFPGIDIPTKIDHALNEAVSIETVKAGL